MLKNVHLIINLEELKQDINCKDHSNKYMEYAAKIYKGILTHVFCGIKTSS